MLDNQAEITRLKSSLIRYFELENNPEIVGVLRASRPTSIEINYDSWHGGVYTYALLLELGIKEFQKFKPILNQVKDEILTAVGLFTQSTSNEYIGEIRFAPLCMQYLNWDALNGVITKKEILQLIELIKSIMISVSTGGPKIQTRENEYKTKYNALNDFLAKLGIDNPNVFKSLWDWYGRWSQTDLPSYAQRRKFISDLYQPIIDIIEGSTDSTVSTEYEPTGWERVDRSVYEMKKRLSVASTEEQYQVIGMLGRDTLISIAQQVFDKTKHKPSDGIEPSKADSKKMLDAYLATEIAGGSNESVRKFAKSAIDMANGLTHDRTASKRDASLCLVSITAVASLIKLIDESKKITEDNEENIPF